MRSRSEVKKDAKRKLNAYWNIPVVVTIAVFLIESIVSGIFRNASLYYVISTLATAFTGVFTTMLFLRIAKNDNLEKVTFSIFLCIDNIRYRCSNIKCNKIKYGFNRG